MPDVQLQNVTKKFGDVTAISDLSMDVRDGELLTLVGPSGCGKSTLLRLIAGLEQPTSGEIYIDHRLVNDLPPSERNVAMVFEGPRYALYPNMTAYDNMAFGLRVRREALADEMQADTQPAIGRGGVHPTREAGIRRRVEQVADKLGLRPYLGRKRRELSAGHSQSVAFGRALVRHRALYLMDDPLSQLDAHARITSRAELKRLHDETRATILYTTADQAEAISLGNRIAVMDAGVLRQIGTSRTLYKFPADMFVAGFIGSPSMNLFPVEIEVEESDGRVGSEESGSARASLVGQGFSVVLPAYYVGRLFGRQRIVLGLRPENIHDAARTPDADQQTVVHARVELAENTGSDLYVHLTADGGPQFVARFDPNTQVRPGQPLDVVFDTTNMYAFDPISGRSLL